MVRKISCSGHDSSSLFKTRYHSYRLDTSLKSIQPCMTAANFWRPIQKVVMPGFRSERYPFHPPNLAIAHIYLFKSEDVYGFFNFSVLPSSCSICCSKHAISCAEKQLWGQDS